MPELSVIVPFCNEHPQVLFTIQSIAQELIGRVDFEILAVDNYCDQVKAQGRDPDGGGTSVEACSKGNPWLKYLKYTDKLSHWQAKNHAVHNSSGSILWFCDAHCVVSRDSLYNMLQYYRANHDELNGTIHLPLTYKILEWRRLIYKLVNNLNRGEIAYSFTGFPGAAREPFSVACMSTCGMMMTRELYDELGGWPVELGIYGGGEHFINFALAVMGKTKTIYPSGPLFHHGDKRGYEWNYNDYTRNRTIASYMFGGKTLAEKFIDHRKGNPDVLQSILSDVLSKCREHRERIKKHQVIRIEEWAEKA